MIESIEKKGQCHSQEHVSLLSLQQCMRLYIYICLHENQVASALLLGERIQDPVLTQGCMPKDVHL